MSLSLVPAVPTTAGRGLLHQAAQPEAGACEGQTQALKPEAPRGVTSHTQLGSGWPQSVDLAGCGGRHPCSHVSMVTSGTAVMTLPTPSSCPCLIE